MQTRAERLDQLELAITAIARVEFIVVGYIAPRPEPKAPAKRTKEDEVNDQLKDLDKDWKALYKEGKNYKGDKPERPGLINTASVVKDPGILKKIASDMKTAIKEGNISETAKEKIKNGEFKPASSHMSGAEKSGGSSKESSGKESSGGGGDDQPRAPAGDDEGGQWVKS